MSKGSEHQPGRWHKKTFGQRLKAIRELRKRTPQEIADRAELSCEFYLRVESGRSLPTLETIISLARVLNVNLGVFFDDGSRVSVAAFSDAPLSREEEREWSGVREQISTDPQLLRLVLATVKGWQAANKPGLDDSP